MRNKLKIYPEIICLELKSSDGGKWWYQGTGLTYTPVPLREISRNIRCVILEGTRKRVLVVPLHISGRKQLVAINLPRSDLKALRAKNLLAEDVILPFNPEETVYSQLPV